MEEQSSTVSNAIAIRILYSYFIDKTKNLSFGSFGSRLRRTFGIAASLAVIREHSKKDSMVLLFDEIGKAGSVSKVQECLRCVSPILSDSLVNCFSRGHVILSSLEVSNITVSASNFGWHIHFVHLNRLSVDSSLGLLQDFTQYHYVQRLIVALGGSPRCLELLLNILKINSHLLGVWNYETLFKNLSASVADYTITYSNLTIEDVGPALLRTKVEMGESVVRNRTYENSVECGMYLNSFTREERECKLLVPIVSPFALAVFASKLLSEDEGSLKYQIGNTLYQLAGFLTREEGGTPFEIAHGLWETLIRLLYQSKHPGESFNLNLSSIYPSFDSKTDFQDFKFVVPGDHFMFELTKKQFKAIDQSQLKHNVIYHFGGSNMGFDLAFYPTAGDFNDLNGVFWNIETSFSTDSTVEPITEIQKKMNLTVDQYKVFLVIVLKRKVANDCYGKSLEDYLLFLKKD